MIDAGTAERGSKPRVSSRATRQLNGSAGEKSGRADAKQRRTPMLVSEAVAVVIGEAVTEAGACDGRSAKLLDGKSERIAVSATRSAGTRMTPPMSDT